MASFQATTDVTSLGERQNQLAEHGLRLEKLLASGAFAEVYKAEVVPVQYSGVATCNVVAAKVYYELAWETRIRHARREYSVTHELQHENVVSVFDLIISESIVFATMELMGGGELLDHIVAGKGLSPDFGKTVMTDVCRGLVYLHEEKSIVHLDIKPENILLTNKLKCKLADFDAALAEGTSVSVVRGTAECHPHEYLPGASNYTIRSQADVWALGLVLYECMVGAYPWESPCMTDPGYADYRTNVSHTSPWSRMPQRTLDIFDSIFTEDVDARADAEEVLQYVEAFYIADVKQTQGLSEVFEYGNDTDIESSFEEPVEKHIRLLALRAWTTPLNTSSEWTVVVDFEQHETHERYLIICIQPRESERIGRIICEERYSRLLALHRMCTALYPQYTPPAFPKKKVFGRRAPDFLEQRATELADYFEQALSIRECLEFYANTPEFHVISSDPTCDSSYSQSPEPGSKGPEFGYGCTDLNKLPDVMQYETSSEMYPSDVESISSGLLDVSLKISIDQEAQELPQAKTVEDGTSTEKRNTQANSHKKGKKKDSGKRKPTSLSYYIAPLDPDGFEASPIHNALEIDTPDWLRMSPKNRYRNILPRWSTRVELRTRDNSNIQATYINANFVPNLEGKAKYIATQGPLAHTVIQFWIMLWQQRVECVVMLCKIHQDGIDKCAQYWPTKPLSVLEVGVFQIELVDIEEHGPYVVNTLQVTSEGQPPRRIRHFWFNTWPDFGVPTTPDGRAEPRGVLKLLRHVNGELDSKNDAPVVVHCSAGIGRTGTYILMDIAIAALKRNMHIDLLEMIDNIRQHRMGLVQRTAQYKLAWQAVISVAQEMIEKNGGGMIYALEDQMNPQLRSKVRRMSMRPAGAVRDWEMGSVNGKDGFQLRGDAKAPAVTKQDNKDMADVSRNSSNRRKKAKGVRGSTIDVSHVGKDVSVSGYNCFGVLRFVGIHKEHGTPRVGVELDKPFGKNNGTVGGHKYFECAPLHGVLCIPTKVKIISRTTPAVNNSIIVEDVESGVAVAVDGFGIGKLRYVGRKGTSDAEVHCGVEFSKPVGNMDGTIDGTTYFSSKDNHGVLVPLTKVKRITPTARDIGRLVSVKGYDCVASLRYFGPHKEKGHLRCGVELEQPIGNNDGTVNDHEYFSCEPGYGVLCAVKKVKIYYEDMKMPSVGVGEASA